MQPSNLRLVKLAACLALPLLTLLGSPGARATETEILTNGGFESSFTGWTQSSGTVESTIVYNGTKSAKIAPLNYFRQFYQTIPFTPGRTVKANGYLESVGMTGSAGFNIQYLNSGGTVISEVGIGSTTGTTGWVYKESVESVSPPNTASIRIRCYVNTNAGGNVYFDLISLKEITSDGPNITFTDQQETEQMTNPGFESGWATWTQSKAQLETVNVHSGASAAKIVGDYYKSFWYRRAAAPGEVYSASLWAASTNVTNEVGTSIIFRDASLASLGGKTICGLRGTRAYRQYAQENVKAPAGTAFVEIFMSSPGGNLGGTSYFDDVSLTKNTGLPIKVVSTYESAGVTVLTDSATADCTLYYRKVGTTPWKNVIAPMFDGNRADDRQFRVSVVNLEPDTDYQLYAFVIDNDITVAQGGVTFSTWKSSPTIAQTYTVAQLYSGGKLTVSNLQGSPNGWIKITGTGSNDVNAAYATDEAIHLFNCAYLILENVAVTGGRRYGIHVESSESIRVQNCDVSGWARTPAVYVGGIAYENQTEANAGLSHAINLDGGVFLDNSAQVTVERSYLHDPRLSANNWDHGHPKGPEGIVVANLSYTGNHVVRYNDIIGSDTVRWNDGIEGNGNGTIDGSFARDSDIQGNMICYGQDDSIELDGGQENVRFFGNKTLGSLCGISTAPNLRGPSYLFRNLLTALADGRGSNGSIVKQGGGTTNTKGTTFFFNNTVYTPGDGLAAVGYGNDANRDMFFGVSRNNVIFGRSTNSKVIEDPYAPAQNSFDYDALWTTGQTTAIVQYGAGEEAHGTLTIAPVFQSAADDDLRLTSTSIGIDDGMVIPNFTETFAGAAPDQGAFEEGTNKLFPNRPINITANRYRVALTATVGGSSSTSTVTLTIGNIGSPVAYSVKKNAAAGWINVTPTSGTLTSNTTLTLTASVNTSGLAAGTRKGAFLIRLANGYSVPVVVEATISAGLGMLENWRNTNFHDPANLGRGADFSDYEGDGLANIVEYGLGLDPLRDSAGQIPQAKVDGDHLVLRFTEPAGITGVIYAAECSPTLAADSWVPVPDSGTPPEHLFSVPLGGSPSLYMRLIIISA